jgi:CheY-specific phosphatase CheX
MANEISLSDVLLESAEEIFETMIFMSLEEASDLEPELEEDTLTGSIWFKGAISGSMAIHCSSTCAKAIAANMLAMDLIEEISGEVIFDAIGEVVNLVMGCMKSRMYESMGDLNVSIPSVVHGFDLKQRLGDDATEISVKVDIDDVHPAELSMWYKEVSETSCI